MPEIDHSRLDLLSQRDRERVLACYDVINIAIIEGKDKVIDLMRTMIEKIFKENNL